MAGCRHIKAFIDAHLTHRNLENFFSRSNEAVMDAFRWRISYRYSHNLREALTARFILKGIPEPLCVRRVVIQTLTYSMLNSKLFWDFFVYDGEN